MNKILLILALICFSCNSYHMPVQDNFKLFFEEIVNDPDKLENIQLNFPNYYKDHITTNLTRRPEFLKEIINMIKEKFNPHSGKIKYVNIDIDRTYILTSRRFDRYIDIIDSSYKAYSFIALKKHDVGLEFTFVYQNTQHYYLLDIREVTIFYDHSSGKYLGD